MWISLEEEAPADVFADGGGGGVMRGRGYDLLAAPGSSV